MHTNGSARELHGGKNCKSKSKSYFWHRWIARYNSYRISTNDKIIKNAKAFIDAGGFAKWHMLVFEHNEHPSGRSTKDVQHPDLKCLQQNTLKI